MAIRLSASLTHWRDCRSPARPNIEFIDVAIIFSSTCDESAQYASSMGMRKIRIGTRRSADVARASALCLVGAGQGIHPDRVAGGPAGAPNARHVFWVSMRILLRILLKVRPFDSYFLCRPAVKTRQIAHQQHIEFTASFRTMCTSGSFAQDPSGILPCAGSNLFRVQPRAVFHRNPKPLGIVIQHISVAFRAGTRAADLPAVSLAKPASLSGDGIHYGISRNRVPNILPGPSGTVPAPAPCSACLVNLRFFRTA